MSREALNGVQKIRTYRERRAEMELARRNRDLEECRRELARKHENIRAQKACRRQRETLIYQSMRETPISGYQFTRLRNALTTLKEKICRDQEEIKRFEREDLVACKAEALRARDQLHGRTREVRKLEKILSDMRKSEAAERDFAEEAEIEEAAQRTFRHG